MIGIRVLIGSGVRVWAGFGIQRYAFHNETDALAFIDENWQQFDPAWRAKRLSIGNLPPVIAINPSAMLIYGTEP